MNAATVYFSVGGTTEKLAEEISLAANGVEIFKLEPQVPYTQADINWHDKQSRSSVEMDDESCRVPLADADFDFSDFDTIFVGFPIWWAVAPRIINTFFETFDLSGKKIALFATSGSSGIETAVQNLKTLYPSLDIVAGKIVADSRDAKQLVSSI